MAKSTAVHVVLDRREWLEDALRKAGEKAGLVPGDRFEYERVVIDKHGTLEVDIYPLPKSEPPNATPQ